MKYIYFGSSKVSVYVLEELIRGGYTPDLIVTTPDKPQGRGLVLTPNIVKKFAEENNIRVIDPAVLDADFETILRQENADVFIVASYGKIIPRSVVEMPPKKTLNMHPSLLPKYRGASPLPTTMIDDAKNTGITIMRLDEKMDHGPIVATKLVTVEEWPTYEVFEEMMAREGGKLLVEILPDWVAGKITETEQNHTKATFTKKIKKDDAQIDLNAADSYLNFRKIQAYHEWPQAYFFAKSKSAKSKYCGDDQKQMRIKITNASYSRGKLQLEKVIPEGSKEMIYADFLKGYSV